MGFSDGNAQASAREGAVVAALCLVQFVDVLGVTVVVTALPAMLRDVGGRPADGTLVATGYAMFFGGLLMFGARVGDRFGHRRTILVGLGVFAAGSLLAATATSVVTLTAARCVQGAAAATAVPSALRLLTTVAEGQRARARAVAAWSAAGAAAGASGFVVGGLVTDLAGWRVIFWGLLVVAAGQTIAVLGLVPRDATPGERRGLELAGSALLTLAVMLLVVGTTFLGEPRQRLTGALLVGGALAVTAVFVATDRRSAAPLLPAALLRTPQLLRGTAGSFANTATVAVATLITLYLQGTLGRPALEAAVTLLPLSLAVIVGAAAAGRMVLRQPRERVTAVGLGLIGAGIALPLLAPASPFLLGSGTALTGCGLGLSAVASTSMGTDVDEPSRATASGVINTSAQLGTAIGTALILLVAAATTGVPDAATGTPVVAWATAAVFALVAAAGFACLRPVRIPV